LARSLLSALALLVGQLPWRALAVLGRALGWLAGSLLRIRRGHVERAMAIAGVASPSREAGAMYAALGRSAFEFLWLATRGGEAAHHVTIDAASAVRWQAALARGRGVVIAATHTGNWDLAACAMARDVELLVVTKHLSAESIDRFWQSTRARQGVTLGDARGAMAKARDVLRRGGAVAMMIDQAPLSRRHTVDIDFLGQPALADRAPAALAAAARAPMVVATARRTTDGAHVLHVLDVIEPPQPASRARAWIAPATVSAAQALEGFVRAYPSQWLWMHRRWKQPAGAARLTHDVRATPGPTGVDPGAGEATLAQPWA
jgi:Kdo2-lipid IVA lauroyltransferase/acyltransferase